MQHEQPQPYTLASAGPTVGPAEALAYAERVFGLRALRAAVKLKPSEVDLYLALVGEWALAGCPAGAFPVKLPALAALVQAAPNTVRSSVEGLVAAGLLASLPTDAAKGRPQQYTLGPSPVVLAANKVQNLNPILATSSPNEVQILHPTAGDRVQYLNPILVDEVQKLNLIGDSLSNEVQNLNPILATNNRAAIESQAVSDSPAAETSASTTKNGHSSSIGNSEVLSKTEQRRPKTRRLKKGDDEFPPEVVESFVTFWIAYGKKGDRYATLKRWAELSLDERAEVLEAAEPYVAHNSGPERYQYRAYAENFIGKEIFKSVLAGKREVLAGTRPAKNPELVTKLYGSPKPTATRRGDNAAGDAPAHLTQYPEL